MIDCIIDNTVNAHNPAYIFRHVINFRIVMVENQVLTTLFLYLYKMVSNSNAVVQ